MSDKLNIAFLCSNHSFGGLEMNMVKMAFYLKKRAWNVLIFALKDSPVEKFSLQNNIPVININKHIKYFDWFNGFKLLKKIKQYKVSCLIVRNNRDLSILAFVKSLLGNNISTIFYQGMQITFDKKDVVHTLRFKKVDTWISPSRFLAGQVKKHTCYPHERIQIIPIGIDTNQFYSALPDKAYAREVLQLPQEKMIAGILGRLDRLKNQEVAISALYECIKANMPFYLLIAGEPTKNEGNDYEKYLKRKIENLGLENYVIFYPFLNNPEYFYSSIDLFLLTSLSEPFGLVTIEAMMSGVPVAGTNSGSTPELLNDGKFGLLFDPENPLELSEIISKKFKYPDLFQQKAREAKNYALNYFNKEVNMEKLEMIIKEKNKPE